MPIAKPTPKKVPLKVPVRPSARGVFSFALAKNQFDLQHANATEADCIVPVRGKTHPPIQIKSASGIRAQRDMFVERATSKYAACPYLFKYKYRTDDGLREGTCQDWELEATYHKWTRLYGEQKALSEMDRVFGQDYPAKGMLLAMGTHSLHQDTWLINGVIRHDDTAQGLLV